MSCALLFWMEPPGAEATANYNATDGLREIIDFRCSVTESEGRRFRGRRACFRLFSPEDLKALHQIGAEHEADDICGFAEIHAGVRGERIKEFGREVELDPIDVRLWINKDTFSSIFRQTVAAVGPPRTFIKIELVGKNVPLITTSEYLDITTTMKYAVQRFEIGCRF